MTSMKWLVGSLSLRCPLIALVAALWAPPGWATKCTAHTPQYLGWGQKEVDLFSNIPYRWGSQGLSHRLSLPSMGEITGPEGLPGHQVLPPWRRDGVDKVKLCLLTFHCSQSQCLFCFALFFSSDVLERLCCAPGVPQRHVVHEWLSKLVFLWGRWQNTPILLFCWCYFSVVFCFEYTFQ